LSFSLSAFMRPPFSANRFASMEDSKIRRGCKYIFK
jgi:hypothetical protein